MDCCKGQSKKRHFSASSFLGQDRHMKEECSFTFSHPGLSSNNGVFLSSRPFLLLYIFRWCFSPSCCSRGSGCWWGDSWGNPSEAAFQIISHDLDIKVFLLIQNIDLLAPHISMYFSSHWRSLRGRNIWQKPWFHSLSPLLSRKVACNHYLRSKSAHV